MLRGIYTAAAGMMAASLREDVVARNLANTDTPGYQNLQARVSEFAPLLVSATAGTLGPLGGGDQVAETLAAQAPGVTETVGNPLAAALTGQGYFAVRTPQGLRYTRDGDFTINAKGQLATRAGDPVLGTNGGPIAVQTGARLVNGGGVQSGGRVVTSLRVMQPRAPQNLVPVGGGLLMDTGARMVTVRQPGIRAGALQMPGGDVSRQMVNLIQAEQAYASSQNMLMTTDQTLNLAVNRVGAPTAQ